jgi:hypothetical protein
VQGLPIVACLEIVIPSEIVREFPTFGVRCSALFEERHSGLRLPRKIEQVEPAQPAGLEEVWVQ